MINLKWLLLLLLVFYSLRILIKMLTSVIEILTSESGGMQPFGRPIARCIRTKSGNRLLWSSLL